MEFLSIKRALIILIFYFALTLFGFSQEIKLPNGKFGGPFSTISYNKHGSAITFGGGGTFIVKNNSYIGIFGQVMSDIIPRESSIEKYKDFNMKSRFTGFWFGYIKTFNNSPKFYIVTYTKIGFGNVNIDNPNNSIKYYDNSILISPQIEAIYKLSSFLEIGLGFFYDFFTGVSLLSYNNSDFNSIGINLSFRFTKAN